MKGRLNRRIAFLIGIAAFVIAVAGVTAGLLYKNAHKKPVDKPEQEYEYNIYHGQAKNLGDYDDVGVMIMDCDKEEDLAGLVGASVTHRPGKYVQGEGALAVKSFLSINSVVSAQFAEKDISAYADKSIHVSMYVSDPDFFGNGEWIFELTSSGIYDEDELCWIVSPTVMKSGWNELYLGMEDAGITGNPDLSKLNYFRTYTPDGQTGLEVFIDNVYATDTPGMSLGRSAEERINASTKPGMLMDCDTLAGISSGGTMQLSTTEGEYKEGKGAIIVSNPDVVWVMANLKPADLSSCNGGKLSFWAYVNDAAYVKNADMCLEISSSGTCDKNEMCWAFSGEIFKTGWNHVELDFPSSIVTEDGIDLKNVNFLRLFATNGDKNLIVILDEFKVKAPQKRTPGDGMILSCDDTDNLRVTSFNTWSLTKNADEHKEGTGAFKSVGAETVLWDVHMDELVDISGYADGGISLWLYVSDPSKIKSTVNVELGSAGTFDIDEYEWWVGDLHEGWNQMTLLFENASVSGTPDLSGINHFRIFGEFSGEITAFLDSVKAVKLEKKAPIPGMILDCDDRANIKELGSESNVLFTSAAGEYKQGSGALKSIGKGQLRAYAVLKDAVDLTDYKNGALSFWAYLGDEKDYDSSTMIVELTSSGAADKNELSWTVRLNTLQFNAWNEIKLNFANAVKFGGDIDFSKVNFFRVYMDKAETSDNALLILDDVHAEKDPVKQEEPKKKELLWNCDDTDEIAVQTGYNWYITHEKGEFKEGTGAFKITGQEVVLVSGVFKEAVDVSDYADKGLHMWLYITDTAAAGNLVVELGSGAASDVQEYQWEIQKDTLKSGAWNEIYLSFASAGRTADGGADLSRINWFRIYAPGCSGEITAILDDVRVAEEKIPGMIFNCDDLDVIDETKSTQQSIITDNMKQGTGAYLKCNSGELFYKLVRKEAVDVSEYSNGRLCFWLYVNDTSYLDRDTTGGGQAWRDTLNIELGSAGSWESEKLLWSIPTTQLQNGWNRIELNLLSPDGNSKNDGAAEIDFTRINFLRIFQNGTGQDAQLQVILDDVHLEEKAADAGVIFNCDDLEGIDATKSTAFSITKDKKKNGTGAYSSNPGQVFFMLIRSETVDISQYSDGRISLWLYINDLSYLDRDKTGGSEAWRDSINIEIGSAGTWDVQELQWTIPLTELQNGWNKIELDLCNPDENTKDQGAGEIDLSKINYFRIFQNGNGQNAQLQTILDDVRVIARKDIPGMFLSGDDLEGIDTTKSIIPAVVTDDKKDGTGAYLSGTGQVLYMLVRSEPVDLLEYVNGRLCFWLYINDVSYLDKDKTGGSEAWRDSINIEIGSAGTWDVEELQWTIPTSRLKNGWNRMELDLSNPDGNTKDQGAGEIDFSRINYFRIFQNGAGQDAQLITKLDGVRALPPRADSK